MNLDSQFLNIRLAQQEDLDALVVIEQRCFSIDRLNRRRFRYHLQNEHCILLVADYSDDVKNTKVVAYALCFLNQGTRLARLYSLAVLPEMQGLSIAKKLMKAIEAHAEEEGRLFMRLEVSKSNHKAIALYETKGYRKFGEYSHYYEDDSDAIRMQKTIRYAPENTQNQAITWYKQTTDFTCGPAALMMAMCKLNASVKCQQVLELDIWRESTTIFMTSGLGGTHPFGLAVAAKRRGFHVELVLNTTQALFTDGVRKEEKKHIMRVVHQQFLEQCNEHSIHIDYRDINQQQIEQWLNDDYAVLILISTYRLDGKKAPHWVLITGYDSDCFYVHDPDVDEKWQLPLDCQHVPIARQDFDKMSSFGSNRLRCAIGIKTASNF